jgi:hypothetical protein
MFLKKMFDSIKQCLGIGKSPNERLLNRNNYLILKPDGSWEVSTANKIIQAHSNDLLNSNLNKTPVKFPPPPSFSPYYRKQQQQDPIGEVLTPPNFFPKKQELTEKLDKCLDMGLITSCVHIITEKNTYILKIEIPADDVEKTAPQIKLFTKAMEDNYTFKTIQQEKVLSKVSDSRYFLVCFEFDPQNSPLNKEIK